MTPIKRVKKEKEIKDFQDWSYVSKCFTWLNDALQKEIVKGGGGGGKIYNPFVANVLYIFLNQYFEKEIPDLTAEILQLNTAKIRITNYR